MAATGTLSAVEPLTAPYDRERLEDVGFMTCMTLVLLGNYAQTGHFGGPLAYTPYNVATHLAGPDLGGLRFDYRRPKHPYSDKFMLAGGHCIPTCYALWMIMGQALARKFEATGHRRYYADPHVAILPIDALGFRRGAGAMATLLQDHGLADHPLFAQAKVRGIRGAGRTRREHRRHQRRQRWPLGNRHRDRSRQGGLLGRDGRGYRRAEDHRLRRRVRDDRGSRAGAEDAGAGAQSRQAAARDDLRQQRRHRRLADRRRHRSQVRRLQAGRSVDLVRLERVRGPGRQRLRPGRRRAEDHGALGSGRSPADGRDRQDDEGLLAGGGRSARFPTSAIRSWVIPAIRTR